MEKALDNNVPRTPIQGLLSNEEDLYHIDFMSGTVFAHPIERALELNDNFMRKVPQEELDTVVFPALREFIKDPLRLMKLSPRRVEKIKKLRHGYLYSNATTMEEYAEKTSQESAILEKLIKTMAQRNERELKKPYITPFLNRDGIRHIHAFGINGKNITIGFEENLKYWMDPICIKEPERQNLRYSRYLTPRVDVGIIDKEKRYAIGGIRDLTIQDAALLQRALNDKDFKEYLKTIQNLKEEVLEGMLRFNSSFFGIWRAFNERKPKTAAQAN